MKVALVPVPGATSPRRATNSRVPELLSAQMPPALVLVVSPTLAVQGGGKSYVVVVIDRGGSKTSRTLPPAVPRGRIARGRHRRG